MRFSTVTKLRCDDRVALPVVGASGTILVTPNSLLTESIIIRLSALGCRGVYVFDSLTIDYEKICDSLDVLIEDSRNWSVSQKDDFWYLGNEIVNQTVSGNFGAITKRIFNLASYDNETFRHCYSVAVCSVVIALVTKRDANDVKLLAIAGLLHDVGKVQIDPKILFKKAPLTKKEFSIIKRHPSMGYEMFAGQENVSVYVQLAILQHHENENGSGYPAGLRSEGICFTAKIIHVSDVYDALMTKRCYKDAVCPVDVYKYFTANKGVLFDCESVEALLAIASLFPIGLRVLLSDVTIAEIVGINNNPTEPFVKRDDGTFIDLRFSDLSIVSIVE